MPSSRATLRGPRHRPAVGPTGNRLALRFDLELHSAIGSWYSAALIDELESDLGVPLLEIDGLTYGPVDQLPDGSRVIEGDLIGWEFAKGEQLELYERWQSLAVRSELRGLWRRPRRTVR